MGHKQDLDNLLHAADLLRDDGVRIALVGGGNEQERLRRSALDRSLGNVDFIGVQAADRVGRRPSGRRRSARQPAAVRDGHVAPVETDLILRGWTSRHRCSRRRQRVGAGDPCRRRRADRPSRGSSPACRSILSLRDDRQQAERLGASGRSLRPICSRPVAYGSRRVRGLRRRLGLLPPLALARRSVYRWLVRLLGSRTSVDRCNLRQLFRSPSDHGQPELGSG